jgi:hypothetical protein
MIFIKLMEYKAADVTPLDDDGNRLNIGQVERPLSASGENCFSNFIFVRHKLATAPNISRFSSGPVTFCHTNTRSRDLENSLSGGVNNKQWGHA